MTEIETRPAADRPRTPWLLIVIVGIGYGLLTTAQVRLSSSLGGRPLPWTTALALQLPIAAAWTAATPGILWLGRRFPLVASAWRRNLLVHLAISLSFVFALDLTTVWYTSLVLPPRPGATPLLHSAIRYFVIWVFSDGLLYWSILAVSYAAEHYRRFREREVRAYQLETQLARAELQALKSQLQPHFLFNALHTIGSLVRTGERDNAVKVTADLGDLLRRMLEGAAQQEVPLRQELDFITSYLAVEQMRFRDRLLVNFEIDPEVGDARVPHLVLQPLVENAIRHGIAPHLFAGKVSVTARRRGTRLELIVRDDGPGVGDGDGARPGIGLSNTRARLGRMYGPDWSLTVDNLPEGGLQARIELPFSLAPAERGAP
jgi:signal transduction histidine kinase